MKSATIETALETVKNRFPFEVKKFPLSGPDNMKTGVYGLFRDDTAEFIGSSSVSDRYVPHTTEDVLALVESVDSIFPEFNCSCYFADGHYVFIQPTDDQRRNICGSNDPIFPRLVIRAGLDGQAFKATMGYYRDMCDNLSMLQTVGATSVSINHTRGLSSRMEDLRETFSRLDSSWESVERAANQMQERRVNLAEFVRAVYGEPAENATDRAVGMHQRRTEAIMVRVLREVSRLGEDVPSQANGFAVSGWLAYNGVQGYQQHDAVRRGQTSDTDRILKTAQDSNVRKAELLALSM